MVDQQNPEIPIESEELTMDQIPPMKPNTWLWQSIVVTLCCFSFFGIVALLYGARVNSFYYAGLYDKAAQASNRAKTWALLGFIIGIIYAVVATIMMLKGNLLEGIGNILSEGEHSIYNY